MILTTLVRFKSLLQIPKADNWSPETISLKSLIMCKQPLMLNTACLSISKSLTQMIPRQWAICSGVLNPYLEIITSLLFMTRVSHRIRTKNSSATRYRNHSGYSRYTFFKLRSWSCFQCLWVLLWSYFWHLHLSLGKHPVFQRKLVFEIPKKWCNQSETL